MRRSFATALLLAAVVGATMASVVVAGDASLPPEWQRVRAAVARYHSFRQALADGYSVAGEACVSAPFGAMGIHAVNEALIADPAIDPLRPELLLYIPRPNGSLKLVGVEYWRVDEDQDVTTSGDRPSVLGVPLEGPFLGHTPGMRIHYDLHVWVAEHNPSGLFAPFNPTLSC